MKTNDVLSSFASKGVSILIKKNDRAEFNKARQEYWKNEWDKGRWDDDDDDEGCP